MSLRTMVVVLVLGAMVVALVGCPKKTADTTATQTVPRGTQGATTGTTNAAQKIKVTAYINVSSGCQASTVKLIDDLGVKYVDLVDLEVVNFGSPEGYRRWESDGMECMGILFDAGNGPSPALKFKGRDGKTKTVVFFMPAGFSWTHEDLEDAFAALKEGKLNILSEEEAKTELASQPVKVTVSVKDTDAGSQILVGDQPVFAVAAEAGGAAPADRAGAAKKAIEKWASEPVNPSQIHVIEKDGAVMLNAGTAKIITVTEEDAKQAAAASAKELAMDWAEGLKKAMVGAARKKK